MSLHTTKLRAPSTAMLYHLRNGRGRQLAGSQSHQPLKRLFESSMRSPYSSSSKKQSPGSESFLTWYSNKLESHPLLIKGITSGVIAATADVICQYLTPDEGNETRDTDTSSTSAKSFHWDTARTLRFWIMGSVWVAPVTHYWYQTLSTQLLPGSRSPVRVLQRLVVDQFMMAPIFVCSFMSGLWVLEGKTLDWVWESLKEVAVDVVQANWSLWIPAQLVNFSLVPLNYQVLFSNVVALVWNVYLSYVSASESKRDGEHAPTREEQEQK